MIRPFTALCLMVAGGSGLYLYSAKHQAQVLDHQIAQVVHQADAIRERAGVLRAEYALLNDPERLGDLATANLPNLHSTAPSQFSNWSDFEKRLPAVGAPPTEPAPLEPDAPAVAAATPGPDANRTSGAVAPELAEAASAAATAAATALVGPAMAAESKGIAENRSADAKPGRAVSPRSDALKLDGTKIDVAKIDGTKADAPKVEAPKADLAKGDGKTEFRPAAPARPRNFAAIPAGGQPFPPSSEPVAPLPSPPSAASQGNGAPSAGGRTVPAPVSLTAGLGNTRVASARPEPSAPLPPGYPPPAPRKSVTAYGGGQTAAQTSHDQTPREQIGTPAPRIREASLPVPHPAAPVYANAGYAITGYTNGGYANEGRSANAGHVAAAPRPVPAAASALGMARLGPAPAPQPVQASYSAPALWQPGSSGNR